MKAQVAEISQSTSETMRLAPCVSSPGQHEKLLVNVRRTDYGTGLNFHVTCYGDCDIDVRVKLGDTGGRLYLQRERY